MKRINSILVITPNYPIEGEPVYSFVQTLCGEFARRGLEVSVLSPQSISSKFLHHKSLRPKVWDDYYLDKRIKVFQPYYVSVPSSWHDVNNFFLRVCLKVFLKKNKLLPDVCYCHFWRSAYIALPYAAKHHIPLFVASGESEISKLFSSIFDIKRLREYVRGVICVSTKNLNESIALGLTTKEKCEVFPNAIDPRVFHQRNQSECRKRLGFNSKDFIVAFVGWFVERKGAKRVAEAIQIVGNVKSIFIGRGESDPNCDGIIFKGVIPHEEIPLYLNAADCFVLPTLHEGCCNAVIEAMACGLPVVSSNLPFNWDVLDESNSIMVDPCNIGEIARAIELLKNNTALRKKLSEGALLRASKLTINNRVGSIKNFIEKRI